MNNKNSPDKHYSHTRYLIISRGRTGSALLSDSLNLHPLIRHAGEVIGTPRLRIPKIKKRILEKGIIRYIEDCYAIAHDEVVVGMKILYYQIETPFAEYWGLNDLPVILDYMLSDRTLKIIHMKRRNRLRTLNSIEMAFQTKQHQLHDENKRIRDIQIELPIERCLLEFNRIGNWENQFDKLFSGHAIFNIFYEDFVNDKDSTYKKLLDFLGVPRQDFKSKMLKQNIRSLPDMIKNYRQLKKYFKGSEWEIYFEDQE